LWDLHQDRSDTKTGGHDASFADNAAAVTIAPPAASVAMQSPLLTFKMALADNANDSLPAVQSVTISHSGTQGVVETHPVAQPDQLPTVLINALQGATHTTIEGQLAGLPSNGSFANSLILALTNPAATDAVATTPAVGAQSPIAPDHTTVPVSSSTTEPAPPVSSPNFDTGNLEGILQNFLSNTAHWSIASLDKGVILYDAGALNESDLKSVTFDFSDGSTLSLVGLPAALPHSVLPLWHVA
jgi:hypothetical protein